MAELANGAALHTRRGQREKQPGAALRAAVPHPGALEAGGLAFKALLLVVCEEASPAGGAAGLVDQEELGFQALRALFGVAGLALLTAAPTGETGQIAAAQIVLRRAPRLAAPVGLDELRVEAGGALFRALHAGPAVFVAGQAGLLLFEERALRARCDALFALFVEELWLFTAQTALSHGAGRALVLAPSALSSPQVRVLPIRTVLQTHIAVQKRKLGRPPTLCAPLGTN